MAKRFLVQTDYKANDQTTSVQRRMNRGFSRFASNITDKNTAIGRSFGSLNKTINRAVAIGMVALAAGAGLAAREYVKLDQTLIGANARFKDTVLGTQQAEQNLLLLNDAARSVGKTTQFTAVQAAAGLNFFAKAGFTSAEAMAVLEDQVNLATVAETDFNRAADISSDLLGALGKNVQDSAQKIKNLKDINRALGLTANAANVDLEDMFETLKIAGPIATAAGEGMHELFAITGALGSAGIKGSLAATALKNAYIRLAAPTDKVTDALTELGLKQADFIDQSGKMKSMVTIMDMIGKASAGLGQTEQLAAFAEIFGLRAVAGATNLSKSLSEVQNIMQRLESETVLKDLADEIRKGLGNQVLILKSGLLELGLQFIQAFEKDGRGALAGLIEFVQGFNVDPLINFAKKIAEVFKFIADNWEILLSFAGGIKAVALAVGAVNIATKLFGLTLAASPVGAFIVTVGLLTTAIILLITKWDELETMFANSKIGKILEKGGGGPFSEGFEEARRQRLAERQAAASETDPRRARLAERQNIGTPDTPTPAPGIGTNPFNSTIDVNFNDKPDNVDVSGNNTPSGVNVNIRPAVSF